MPTIRIYETIQEKTVEKLMPVLDEIKPGSTITFKLISKGARRSNHEPLLKKIHELRYYHNCHLIAEGVQFYSAAFLLFIMCNERIIIPESIGMIHLPEFSKRELAYNYEMGKKKDKMQQEHAELISRYTGLTVKQVYQNDCNPFNAGQLLKWKVADKAVSFFTY